MEGSSETRNTAKFWSIYASHADRCDKSMVNTWTKNLDSVLILAGFSSVLITAFVIESSRLLKPDPNDVVISLLQEILAVQSATSIVPKHPLSSVMTSPFRPSASAIWANIFWYTSLITSLTAAITVTLAHQWLRVYWLRLHANNHPVKRSKIRMILIERLEKLDLESAMSYIPTLLHVSLILFFVGLCIFLLALNHLVAIVATTIVGCFVMAYVTITLIQLFEPSSPYGTPLSHIFWNLAFRWIPFFLSFIWCKGLDLSHFAPLDIIVERHSTYRTTVSNFSRALRWVYEEVCDDSDEEAFLACIPGLLRSPLGLPAWNKVFPRTSHAHIASPQIEQHIYHSLESSRSLDVEGKKQRATICLDALFAIFTQAPVHWSGRRIGFSPNLHSLRTFLVHLAEECKGDGQEDSYLLSIKAICSAGLCIHQSPENPNFSHGVINNSTIGPALNRPGAKLADQALRELDHGRQKLENVLSKSPISRFEVTHALDEYLERLRQASLNLESWINILRKSLDYASPWGIPNSLICWYSSIPQPDSGSDELELSATHRHEPKDCKYSVYSLRVMAFMRETKVYPVLPDFVQSRETGTWFSRSIVPNATYLHRELQPLTHALKTLEIDILNSHVPKSAVPIADQPPLLPIMMMKSPFTMYTSLLQEIHSLRPAPTAALYEITIRLYDLKGPANSTRLRDWSRYIITRTLATLYPPGLSRDQAVAMSDSRPFLTGVLHMIRKWTNGNISAAIDVSNKPCAFLEEDITRLGNETLEDLDLAQQLFAEDRLIEPATENEELSHHAAALRRDIGIQVPLQIQPRDPDQVPSKHGYIKQTPKNFKRIGGNPSLKISFVLQHQSGVDDLSNILLPNQTYLGQ